MSDPNAYDDACAATITAKRARHAIEVEHGCQGADGWEGFIAQHGERETYKGSEVLGWLGY